MHYLAYQLGESDEVFIDISTDILVEKWGAITRISATTQRGIELLVHFFGAKKVILAYGPNGNLRGLPRYEGNFDSAYIPQLATTGSTMIMSREGDEKIGNFEI